jgi:hypothetical protein
MAELGFGRPDFWINLSKRLEISLIFTGFLMGFPISEINICASCFVLVAELLLLEEEKNSCWRKRVAVAQ